MILTNPGATVAILPMKEGRAYALGQLGWNHGYPVPFSLGMGYFIFYFQTEMEVNYLIKDCCAGGLVFYQSQLVVLERFNKAWLFPKGHIDPGETAPEAAIREVREECGLTARILAELGETSYTFMEMDQEHFKTVQWYLMEAISGEITYEKEFFTAVKLIGENQIGSLTFEPDRKLAKKGFQIFKSMLLSGKQEPGDS